MLHRRAIILATFLVCVVSFCICWFSGRFREYINQVSFSMSSISSLESVYVCALHQILCIKLYRRIRDICENKMKHTLSYKKI